MAWIDNAGYRINILEEDDLRMFVELKGSKVIVLADPSDKEIIINEFSGSPRDVNGNNIRYDQSIKTCELKCSGCNVELRGIRFECTDRFNFYLCFLCGMSKKQYNLATAIHTVQPLSDSHTMITSSSQTKEISEWMENSRKIVIDLMNELKALEETLISKLRRGTTAVKTVATHRDVLQDNLRGSKLIKKYQQISSPKNSSDSSLDWQGPNNILSKHSKETVSSDDISSDESNTIPSKRSRENPKDCSDDSSSEEENIPCCGHSSKSINHIHDALISFRGKNATKSSSDSSSSDEDDVKLPFFTTTTANLVSPVKLIAPDDEAKKSSVKSPKDSSLYWLRSNNFPSKSTGETVNDSSDDSSSDEDDVQRGRVKPSLANSRDSSDDSSSDDEDANIIPSKSSKATPMVSCGCCSSSDNSPSDEDNEVHVQDSTAASIHSSNDKPSDNEETRKDSLAIPISSVQPTLIENMNLPNDLLQWIQWINRTQQN